MLYFIPHNSELLIILITEYHCMLFVVLEKSKKMLGDLEGNNRKKQSSVCETR